MKDRVFSGADVEEAVAVAAASLGLPRAGLRYVVLDPGEAGGRGLKPTPARIAVLLEEPHRRGAAASARAGAPGRCPSEPRAGLRATIRAVAEAGGLDVEAEIEETDAAVVVRLQGADAAFFVGEDGRGDALRATEHLLQRLYGAAAPARSPCASPARASGSVGTRPSPRRRAASPPPCGRTGSRGRWSRSTPTSGASSTSPCRTSRA